MVDSQARLRFVNEAALRLFGLRIEDVLGANLIEALPSFGIDAAMRAALQDGQSSAQEIHLYAPQVREVFLRVAPVYSGAGAEAGAVAIVQDMTELRRLERVRRDFVAQRVARTAHGPSPTSARPPKPCCTRPTTPNSSNDFCRP